MKLQKTLFTLLTAFTMQTIYNSSGFLKLIVNKNPNKYKVNVQGYGNISRVINFIGGREERNNDAEFTGEVIRYDNGQLAGAELIDYQVPKNWNNGRLFILLYDRKTNQRIGAAHLLDVANPLNVNNSLITLIPLNNKTGATVDSNTPPQDITKIDAAARTIAANHDIAFRVIVDENGTIKIAE